MEIIKGTVKVTSPQKNRSNSLNEFRHAEIMRQKQKKFEEDQQPQ